jgi:hypothetical protein
MSWISVKEEAEELLTPQKFIELKNIIEDMI